MTKKPRFLELDWPISRILKPYNVKLYQFRMFRQFPDTYLRVSDSGDSGPPIGQGIFPIADYYTLDR
jgi:hypothetical protein